MNLTRYGVWLAREGSSVRHISTSAGKWVGDRFSWRVECGNGGTELNFLPSHMITNYRPCLRCYKRLLWHAEYTTAVLDEIRADL
jgi:hypothetical protein